MSRGYKEQVGRKGGRKNKYGENKRDKEKKGGEGGREGKKLLETVDENAESRKLAGIPMRRGRCVRSFQRRTLLN